MDFITVSGIRLLSLPDETQALAGLYAPLDGINEMGLAVSVNMIQDNATIDQNTIKQILQLQPPFDYCWIKRQMWRKQLAY